MGSVGCGPEPSQAKTLTCPVNVTHHPGLVISLGGAGLVYADLIDPQVFSFALYRQIQQRFLQAVVEASRRTGT